MAGARDDGCGFTVRGTGARSGQEGRTRFEDPGYLLASVTLLLAGYALAEEPGTTAGFSRSTIRSHFSTS